MTMSFPCTFSRPDGASRLSMRLALTAIAVALALPASGQTGPADPASLRAAVERRFDILPVRDGIVLHPKVAGGVRAVEIAGGTIAIDGQPVTGAELRARLPADADLVLQVSYLDETQRRALFAVPASPTSAASPSPADVPAPPPPPPPPAAAPAPPAPPRPTRPSRRERRGDVVRFGGSVTVNQGETIPGDVVVLGGAAHVRGTVLGDVVVVGGSLELGPDADVEGDAVVVGGSLRREPGATVRGSVQEVAVGPLNINWRGPGRDLTQWWGGGTFGPTFSLVATLIRVGVLCLLAALVVLFARDYTDRVAVRAAAEPVKAGAIGILAQILFFPVLIITIVLFAVTIIGIPLLLLLPFAVLGLVVFALAGFTAVAAQAGQLVTRRLGWTQYGPIATAVIGVVVVTAPVILGRLVGVAGGPLWFLAAALIALGLVAEYLAWTVGIGAVALLRFSRGLTGGGAVTGPVGPTTSGPLGPPATDSVSPA